MRPDFAGTRSPTCKRPPRPRLGATGCGSALAEPPGEGRARRPAVLHRDRHPRAVDPALRRPHARSGRSTTLPRGSTRSAWTTAGIDMVSLLIQGGRISLIVGFAAALVAMVIGGGIGIIAGYFGGWTRQRPDADHRLLPRDPRPAARDHRRGRLGCRASSHLIFVIALLLWTTTARIVRAQVKSVRERVYVKRARSLGCERHPDHLPARPAADRPAADREHRADGRGRDLRRDRAGVPRAR